MELVLIPDLSCAVIFACACVRPANRRFLYQRLCSELPGVRRRRVGQVDCQLNAANAGRTCPHGQAYRVVYVSSSYAAA